MEDRGRISKLGCQKSKLTFSCDAVPLYRKYWNKRGQWLTLTKSARFVQHALTSSTLDKMSFYSSIFRGRLFSSKVLNCCVRNPFPCLIPKASKNNVKPPMVRNTRITRYHLFIDSLEIDRFLVEQ